MFIPSEILNAFNVKPSKRHRPRRELGEPGMVIPIKWVHNKQGDAVKKFVAPMTVPRESIKRVKQLPHGKFHVTTRSGDMWIARRNKAGLLEVSK